MLLLTPFGDSMFQLFYYHPTLTPERSTRWTIIVVAALPPDVRKASAFPIRFSYFDRGHASNLRHSLTFRTSGGRAAISPRSAG